MSERPRRTSNISYIEPNSSTDDSDVDHDGGNSSSTKKNRSKAPSMKKARFADDSFGIKSSEKRKGKGKGKAVTKRKGKAQILLTMPLDIFSICAHLSPGDLYHLSLVSKNLRAIVSSSLSSLWSTARATCKLPTLSALNTLTEVQYAVLVFGTKCQTCGKSAGRADFFLRRRLCKPCRKTVWTKLSAVRRSKKYHPATTRCLPITRFSPSQWVYEQSTQYVSLPDIEIISGRLFELEEEDREIDVKEVEDDSEEEVEESSEDDRRKKKKRGQKKQKVVKPAKQPEIRSSLLEDYIQKRTLMVAEVTADANKIRISIADLTSTVKEDKVQLKGAKKELGKERRRDIETRVLKLEGWGNKDFTGKWHNSTLINKAERLTDEIWENIQPSVLKLLAKIRTDSSVADKDSALRARQSALSPYHRQLRFAYADEETDRDKFPIFADFLHLPSVVPFWKPDDAAFDKATWKSQIEEIKEEADALIESVRISAIKTILKACCGDEETLEQGEESYGEDLYNDSFFNRPTSWLFCNLPECRTKILTHSDHYWGYRRRASKKLTPFHYSSFQELLVHQHLKHSYTRLEKATDKGHFELPTVIFDVMAAALVSAGKGLLGATKEDVSEISNVMWTNSKTARKKRGLKDLLQYMYASGKKTRGSELGEDPIITSYALGRICGKFADDAKEDGEQDQDLSDLSEAEDGTGDENGNGEGSGEESGESDSASGSEGDEEEEDEEEEDEEEEDEEEEEEVRDSLRRQHNLDITA